MPATRRKALYDVFVSYSHVDSEWVWTWLVPRLKAKRLTVYTDRDSFDIGVPSLINMENAVAASRHTLLVLTPAYVDSEWAIFEQILTQTQDPIGLRHRTLPVLREPCQLPPRIAMLTYVDLCDGADVEKEFARLVKAIRDMRNLPARQGKKSRSSLVAWWERRGYRTNPFDCSNAGDVTANVLPERFTSWYVDPNWPVSSRGYGPTPTLDGVIQERTSDLVLIYAPAGGGKTFFRRWAAYQINEPEADEIAVEVFNLIEHLNNPNQVTGHDLALCLYDSLRTEMAAARKSSDRSRIEGTALASHTLRECEKLLSSKAQHLQRVYVLVDDIAQLFEGQPAGSEANALMLNAVTELCVAAAERSGGERLALRLLLPIELRAPIRERLGPARLRRTHEQLIEWTPAHCEAVIEQRLSHAWVNSSGAGIAVTHLGRLLSEDAASDFREWLHRQQNLSPRSLIDFFNRLANFAFQNEIGAKVIGSDTWHRFLAQEEAGELEAPP